MLQVSAENACTLTGCRGRPQAQPLVAEKPLQGWEKVERDTAELRGQKNVTLRGRKYLALAEFQAATHFSYSKYVVVRAADVTRRKELHVSIAIEEILALAAVIPAVDREQYLVQLLPEGDERRLVEDRISVREDGTGAKTTLLEGIRTWLAGAVRYVVSGGEIVVLGGG